MKTFMKLWPLWLAIAVLVQFIPVVVKLVYGCPKGTVEFEGICADMPSPEAAPTVKPSDENPPRSGMPGYQAEGIAPIPDLA